MTHKELMDIVIRCGFHYELIRGYYKTLYTYTKDFETASCKLVLTFETEWHYLLEITKEKTSGKMSIYSGNISAADKVYSVMLEYFPVEIRDVKLKCILNEI